MQLSLKTISYHRLTPGQQEIFQPQSDSFTIGRSDENDWAIPDPQRFLSGVHCRIHCEGDHCYLTDTSTNGVFLNGSGTRLERNETVELSQGDKIRIGDYEFEVLIEESYSSAPPLAGNTETVVETKPTDDLFGDSYSDPFDDPFKDPEPQEAPQADDDFLKDINTPLAHIDDSPIGNAISIESLMDLDDLDDPDDQPSAAGLREKHTPLNEAFTPSSHISHDETPKPQAGFQSEAGSEIPDNWDEATGMLKAPAQEPEPPSSGSSDLLDEWPDDWDEESGLSKDEGAGATPKAESTQAAAQSEPEAEPAPEPVPEPEPEPEPVTPAQPDPKPAAKPGNETLAAFIRGAGLEPGALDGVDETAFFEQVGKMMLEFTDGLVQTLSGRTHIKSEFRLDQTMIRPVENNPFKFSTSKTGTLQQVLSKSNPAYMAGADAIREGFDDVNAHQMAVVAGMEAALQDILKRFNPKKLETRLDSDSILDNILPGGKKAKYWDIFKLLFDEIAGEAEDDFQQLFGRKFSRAYEQQLSRLKKSHEE
ncbi:MAG: type VI secretion system-associated FHA domain protein TagH [Xanthomonadales bacterium]|nr:type VI secretion system-associated FHA domain protein TagH [Xanthomonadales bacterium]